MVEFILKLNLGILFCASSCSVIPYSLFFHARVCYVISALPGAMVLILISTILPHRYEPIDSFTFTNFWLFLILYMPVEKKQEYASHFLRQWEIAMINNGFCLSWDILQIQKKVFWWIPCQIQPWNKKLTNQFEKGISNPFLPVACCQDSNKSKMW